jgi:hypothetical protein
MARLSRVPAGGAPGQMVTATRPPGVVIAHPRPHPCRIKQPRHGGRAQPGEAAVKILSVTSPVVTLLSIEISVGLAVPVTIIRHHTQPFSLLAVVRLAILFRGCPRVASG